MVPNRFCIFCISHFSCLKINKIRMIFQVDREKEMKKKRETEGREREEGRVTFCIATRCHETRTSRVKFLFRTFITYFTISSLISCIKNEMKY